MNLLTAINYSEVMGIIIGVSIILLCLYYFTHLRSTPENNCWNLVIGIAEFHAENILMTRHEAMNLPDELTVGEIVRLTIEERLLHADCDQIVETIDPDHYLFQSLRKRLNTRKEIGDREFLDVLESAIYSFNINREYRLTIEQLLMKTSNIFDHVYGNQFHQIKQSLKSTR